MLVLPLPISLGFVLVLNREVACNPQTRSQCAQTQEHMSNFAQSKEPRASLSWALAKRLKTLKFTKGLSPPPYQTLKKIKSIYYILFLKISICLNKYFSVDNTCSVKV